MNCSKCGLELLGFMKCRGCGHEKEKQANPSDTEILNWIESQGKQSLKWKIQTEGDHPFVKGCVFVGRSTLSGFETIRDAIEHAMLNENDE